MKSLKFTKLMKASVLMMLIVSLAVQSALGQATGPSDLVVTHMIGDDDGYGYGLPDGATLPATEHPEGCWYFDNRTESELADPYARFTDYELPDHPNALLIHNIDISLFNLIDSVVYTVDISGLHSNRKCRMFVDDNEQFEFAELPSQSARGSDVFTFSIDPAMISDGELVVEFRRLLNVNEPKWGADWALDYARLTVFGKGITVTVPSLVAPENGASLPPSQPIFLWHGDAESYHIQIASDIEFVSLVDEAWPLSSTHTATTMLDVGTYFWRVAGHSQWQISDFSEVWSFTIRGPELSVEPLSLDFSFDIVSQDLTVTNVGLGFLTVTAGSNQLGLGLSIFEHSLGEMESGLIEVTIDRSVLAPGDYVAEVTISSNGGDIIVPVSLTVSAEPVLHVSPTDLNFGIDQNELTIRIANIGGGTLEWLLASDKDWISSSPAEGSQTNSVAVTIDRLGLLPGDYSGSVTISSNADEATVFVSMTVTEPPEIPELQVAPIALAFSTNIAQQSLLIRNIGTGTLSWAASTDQAWIDLRNAQGNTTTETDSILVSVYRDELESGVHTGFIIVTSNGGTDTVSISMEVQTPPVLELAPMSLDFGSDLSELALTINNLGELPLQWNAVDNQGWIGINPGGGIVTSEPDQILVTVDRTGLAPGEHSGLVTVISNGGNDSAEIFIIVPEIPELAVSTDSLDYGLTQSSQTFKLSNTGNGTLDWSLVADMPWIMVSPQQGSITEGSQDVTVTVDRNGLAPGTYGGNISISSNGGSGQITVVIEIEASPVLSVTPLNLSFDRSQTELSFSIANSGGGEVLWTVAADQTWISLNPTAGSATTETDIVTVTVDRSGLNPGQYSGVITVSSDYGTMAVSVDLAVNSSPVFTGGTENTTVVEWATFQRVVTATDPDGDDLQILCPEKPTNGNFVDNGDGTGLFTFTPDYQYVNQDIVIKFVASDGLSSALAEFQLSVKNFQLQVGQTGDDFDVAVNGQIDIPFNEPVMESSLNINLVMTSAHGATLEYDYFGFGSTTPVLVVRPPQGELFADLDTIQVRLIGGPNGVLDLAGLPLESDYFESFVTGASVYPGDTDDNGVVDERDILPLGLYYNQPGPARDVTGILWEVYMAHAMTPTADWSPPQSVYSDADGNGIVNGDDICAVADNWQNRVPGSSSSKSQTALDGLLALKQLERSKLIRIYQALAECPQSTGQETIRNLLDNALGSNESALPTRFSLYQNYPNPFNPATNIQFNLPEASRVRLTVYNVAGQQVTVLHDGRTEAGVHTVIWNGRDAGGQRVASGVYLYRLVADGESITRRMLLLK